MIADHLKGKRLLGDNFQISVEAKLCKKENPFTIDATIGSLKNEQGKIFVFNTVDNIVRNLQNESIYTYSPLDGGEIFHNSVIDWVFGNYKDSIIKKMYYQVIATSGGAGAVSNALTSTLNKGETLILPNIFWGPYATMASINEIEILKYEMLKGNEFNIDGFREAIESVSKSQKNITIILNDPCNNPTGYTLSDNELEKIVEILNQKSESIFNLIYDIAYFDYAVNDQDIRKKFSILSNVEANTIISIAFSCSKTFSIYGLRTGAQIILGKKEKDVNELYEASKLLSRARWSNVTRVGIELTNQLMSNKQLLTNFKEELSVARNLLKIRSEIFLKDARKYNLDYYPYYGGFFITIKYDNCEILASELKKDDIFVIPLTDGIRISISALTTIEIAKLGEKIKKAIDSCKKNN